MKKTQTSRNAVIKNCENRKSIIQTADENLAKLLAKLEPERERLEKINSTYFVLMQRFAKALSLAMKNANRDMHFDSFKHCVSNVCWELCCIPGRKYYLKELGPDKICETIIRGSKGEFGKVYDISVQVVMEWIRLQYKSTKRSY